jgi:hypothetical protein
MSVQQIADQVARGGIIFKQQDSGRHSSPRFHVWPNHTITTVPCRMAVLLVMSLGN